MATINGTAGKDVIEGTNKDDRIYAKKGADTVKGYQGNDLIYGEEGRDSLQGGEGRDTINGGNGHDTINGGSWADLLQGGSGNDVIEGGKGNDTQKGGSGNDTLISGHSTESDRDILTGGDGSDTFNLRNHGKTSNDYAIITDFNSSLDSILTQNTSLIVQEGSNVRIKTNDSNGYTIGIVQNTTISQIQTRISPTPRVVTPNQPPVVDAPKTHSVNEDNSIPLQIAAPTDPNNDSLTIRVTGLPNSSQGQVQLSNGTPISQGQILTISQLTNLHFETVNNANGNAGSFSYEVSDGKGGTSTSSVSLSINPINDAPILNTNYNPTLASANGATVAEIVPNGSITDPDGSAVEAIAVTSVDNSHGNWQYSPNNGGTWLNFGSPSNSTARLLGANDQIRFLPDPGYNGSATFSFRGWDQTTGTVGNTASTNANGGTSAFSSQVETASVTVSTTPPPNPETGEIQGKIWHDANGNGVRDAGESGLSGWTVYLDQNQNSLLDTGEASTTTNSNGDYSFKNLTPGTYTVGEVLQPGWRQTYPHSSSHAALSVNSLEMFSDGIANGATYAPQELIVKLAANVSSVEINTLSSDLGISSIDVLSNSGIELWSLNNLTVAEAISLYGNDPRFEYVQPNYEYEISSTSIPNDTNFSELWGLNNTGQTGGKSDGDIDAPEAWHITTGDKRIKVAVIDTGVNYNHPDLVDNIWTNRGEIPGNGKDDDGNGYVDDIHGYDFVNKDGKPLDDQGHGTHVAGTIGAMGNNNQGVIGVNPDNVQIMPIKSADSFGSLNSSSIIQGIEYAVKMGVDVINASFGSNFYNNAVYDAVASAGEAGVLFIAAAGNNGRNQASYPAGYDLDNIISVAATDHNDDLPLFSNYHATSVDLAAPGVSIYSTTRNGGYGYMSGTSMATPHVVGVASLLWSQHPDWTASEIKQAILDSVDPVSSLEGKTLTGGRLNAYNALNRDRPTVPTNAYTVQLDASEVIPNIDFGNRLIGNGESSNNAPVLDNSNNHLLTSIVANTANPDGDTIASIISDGAITDADGAVEAIALTALDTSNGLWEYSLNGSNWQQITVLSESNALLLDGTDKIRFLPNTDYIGTANFSFRAWDKSLGNAGEFTDTTINGGETAFSSAVDTAEISIVTSADNTIPYTGLEFDGTDDYVQMDGFTFNPGRNNFEIEVWFKTTDDNGTIFSTSNTKGNNDDDYVAIKIDNGKAIFGFSNGQSVAGIARSSSPVNDGKWHHLKAIRDAARQGKLFLDGELVDSFNFDGLTSYSSIDTNTPVVIGKNSSDHTNYFQGTIDRLIVSDKNNTVIANWQLNEGEGNSVTDSSGYNHHGSINGATWVNGIPPETESASNSIYFSLSQTNNNIGSQGSRDEDIIHFDGNNFTTYFDGSDVGLSNYTIGGLDVISENEILISFTKGGTLNGLSFDDSDILKFTATNLGQTTSGTFEMYFDGSDVGLTSSSEEIDAFTVLPDGDILISTTGSPSVTGVSGDRDEDLLRFSPTSLGNNTSGTWSLYFDGSDVGLKSGSEDVDSVALDSQGKIYLSTSGSFSVSEFSGADEDVFVFNPTSIGTNTTGEYESLFFDGSSYGVSHQDIRALDLSVISDTETALTL